tara:strand:- start:332 stop:598 length:267 start_codon:yes stop_codon:yes gene_type:complete
MTSNEAKLTNKQKEQLAWNIMNAVVNEIFIRNENKDWSVTDGGESGFEEFASTEEGLTAIYEQAAVWMMRLPGEIWNLDLPKVWEKNN